MFTIRSLVASGFLLAGAGSSVRTPHSAAPAPITANDNRTPAGVMRAGVLELSLDVREGAWRPMGAIGDAATVLAFGESGKPLQNPGPLLRVRAGQRINVRVHNTAKTTLVVHGLADRRRAHLDTLVVPPSETRTASFVAAEPGTFFYWGTTTGVAFTDRFYEDSQLNGAIIVDPAAGAPRRDRVFVLSMYLPQKDSAGGPDFTNFILTFNGLAWPNTERITVAQGDSVHWRFVNANSDVHPLHLHGFYFRVTARGDLQRDTLYRNAQERMGVTELLDEGTTASLSWYADRPGGWVFHCHLNYHVLANPVWGPVMRTEAQALKEWLSPMPADDAHGTHAAERHAETGMGGLMIAMTVTPKAEWKPYSGPRERHRLFIQSDSQPKDTLRRYGYALANGNMAPDPRAVKFPGPPIILHRGKPSSVMVINNIAEPSQVHWHGLELDSYYDGVAGLSRNGSMVSPMIAPRDSFEMTVTPPRAGSFMYHTHINDVRQQSRGLYGPIIVLDSGETWNPETDLIFQVGTDPTLSPVLNGSVAPPPMTLKLGQVYRMRLMNVSLDVPFNQLWLVHADGASPRWTPLAKDGFDLPVWQRMPRYARQVVSIGETHDFQVNFTVPGEYELQARRGNGLVYARQVIRVVK